MELRSLTPVLGELGRDRVGTRKQALVVVPLVIATLTGVFAVVGLFVVTALGIAKHLQMPPSVRVVGIGTLALGFAFMAWIFRYRSPVEIVTSTYETMRNAGRPLAAQRTSARTEPLVVLGPHRHVRHPLYFAVVVLFVGWWLLLGYTVLVIMAILFLIWFRMVVIRFEERELRMLFADYDAYSKAVPTLFPSLTARWP
jgi:protein-S-isoprenylcysteine O-methyltransferase Ste14